jgi:3-oxoacyl-[acyl-carrier protein] reductase
MIKSTHNHTLQPKTALVTGVSRGIGKEITCNLIKNGYTVHGTYNQSYKQAKQLKLKYGNKIKLHKVNFCKRNQTLKFLNKLESIKFDTVVNNAGMFELENINQFNYQTWDNTLEVNLTTPLLITLTLKRNIKRFGSVVNISSTDAMTGSFASTSYAASKAALLNLTKSLANNLGSLQIRVNCISPGWINTSMATKQSYNAGKLTPLGRNGKAKEVAEVVAFLISNKASFINGTNIVVDGGYTNVDSIMKDEAYTVK